MRSAWKFLSSVKLAIVLIILLTVASIVGTLIPQGRSLAEYSARYGSLSGLFMALRLTRLYQSAWYLALLLLFAANTIVCTISRFGPKWRRAFRPAPEAEAKSVASMRASARFRLPLTLAAARDRVAGRLKARRYRLDESARDGKTVILARKRRLGCSARISSTWGFWSLSPAASRADWASAGPSWRSPTARRPTFPTRPSRCGWTSSRRNTTRRAASRTGRAPYPSSNAAPPSSPGSSKSTSR